MLADTPFCIDVSQITVRATDRDIFLALRARAVR